MPEHESPASAITKREKAVLCCLRDGSCAREIAEDLGISQRTVKFHIGNILRKLEASNRTQAVVLSMPKGVID